MLKLTYTLLRQLVCKPLAFCLLPKATCLLHASLLPKATCLLQPRVALYLSHERKLRLISIESFSEKPHSPMVEGWRFKIIT